MGRVPGGSERPKVVYVAVRWNDSEEPKEANGFYKNISKKLGCCIDELAIYNLCRPSYGRGMEIRLDELGEVEDTIRRIKERGSVRRIAVGGVTQPMPLVALLLKLLLPRVRIEIRKHHKARPTPERLKLVKVLRA